RGAFAMRVSLIRRRRIVLRCRRTPASAAIVPAAASETRTVPSTANAPPEGPAVDGGLRGVRAAAVEACSGQRRPIPNPLFAATGTARRIDGRWTPEKRRRFQGLPAKPALQARPLYSTAVPAVRNTSEKYCAG